MVITEVFARRIQNSRFDANQDDSAWGFAIELANPTEERMFYASYDLELKSQDGNTTIVPLSGTPPLIPPSGTTATAPSKRVVYSYHVGPDQTLTPQDFFGESIV